ncbi:MAG: NAD(P)/FAD-dependent oxidoreductase [Bacteroidales bacterium]
MTNKQFVDITISAQQAFEEQNYRKYLSEKINNIPKSHIITLIKRSIDARNRNIKINCRFEITNPSETVVLDKFLIDRNVTGARPVMVVGSGPAGMFAAIELIRMGLKPIVIERGTATAERKKDLARMYRNLELNEESNMCFGAGGAGTFTDGKLYTRSKKKQEMQQVLSIFHEAGANNKILIDTHPHIGSDKLPAIVDKLLAYIIQMGGEVLYNTKFQKLHIKSREAKGIILTSGQTIDAEAVVLATGHSARDVYYNLHEQGVALEAKAFALGVRIEHPRKLIDSMQYHTKNVPQYLPSATYSFAEQVDGRGVYSFCMCPGGLIVPSSTQKGELLVNGMSPSHRKAAFSNSGLVVELRLEDFEPFSEHGDLKGLEFQRSIEKLTCASSEKGLVAPAQRIADFCAKKTSSSKINGSYIPGYLSTDINKILPSFIADRLRQGILQIDKKKRGFCTNEGQLVAVESRTSSPVRIPREKHSLQHPYIKGLYPCGEGAGFAGGITSSAIDGILVARRIADNLN